jgi:bifunctional non-homologous end joining protein LigD
MERMRPMLATRGTHVPTGEEWQHEVKWDGMRVLADVRRGATRLYSRNELDATVSFPELTGLPVDDVLLDGEVVAFADGLPSFAALAERMHVSRADRALRLAERSPATLLVFDVLRSGDRDLLDQPLHARRKVLEDLDLNHDRWQTPPVYADGQMLFDATYQQSLEGIVSKRTGSRYRPGQRSKDWLKFAHRRRRSYVVGGWRLETDSRDRLGAVLVGEPSPAGLLYRGRVGSGLAGRKAAVLSEVLSGLVRDSAPFVDDVPRVDALGTTWVEPVLVVDIESLGPSAQGRIRQPSYVGTRADLTPADLAPADLAPADLAPVDLAEDGLTPEDPA